MNPTQKSIFISRHLKSDSPFKQLINDVGFTITAEPLIKITQIRYSYTPQTKWIFFTSKNAMDHFFSQDPDLQPDVKYAVISETSAEHLLSFGKTATFTGEGVDLINIGKAFSEVLRDESVLFPQAIDSYQTIQKQLGFINGCFNLYVYKTNIKTDFTIPYSDILIFTSPSNVEAYFNKYKFDPRQSIIAMGASTRFKLKEYGISNAVSPKSFNEKGLLDALAENNFI